MTTRMRQKIKLQTALSVRMTTMKEQKRPLLLEPKMNWKTRTYQFLHLIKFQQNNYP